MEKPQVFQNEQIRSNIITDNTSFVLCLHKDFQETKTFTSLVLVKKERKIPQCNNLPFFHSRMSKHRIAMVWSIPSTWQTISILLGSHKRFYVRQVCSARVSDMDQDANVRDAWDLMPSLGCMRNAWYVRFYFTCSKWAVFEEWGLLFERNPDLDKWSSRNWWNKSFKILKFPELIILWLTH